MYFRVIAVLLVSLLAGDRLALGDMITQVASVPLTPTDWQTGQGSVRSLNFLAFDPGLGTLTSVSITLEMSVRNNYTMVFPNTVTPTTLYLATTLTHDTTILSNPSLVAQLTDGPDQTLRAPDGSTVLLGAPEARLPVHVVIKTEPTGTWSSMFPADDPHHIMPTIAQLTVSRVLGDHDPLLAQFIGTRPINLTDMATANSSFVSSSGNGFGAVSTEAGAMVTVQYTFVPSVVPEPSVFVLGIVGLCALALVYGRFHSDG